MKIAIHHPLRRRPSESKKMRFTDGLAIGVDGIATLVGAMCIYLDIKILDVNMSSVM